MIEWIVAKEVLEGACEIIGNVPPRNGIKASEYIKISKSGKDGASFTLSSDLMAKAVIRTGERFPFAEDVFLDRRLFIPFVDAGKEQKSLAYKFKQHDDGKITVRHGHRRGSYEKLKAVSGYEDVPDMKDAKAASLDKRWINLVDAARDCATDDPITPFLNCVYITPAKKHLQIFASNDRVIFMGKAKREKSIKHGIAFPLMLIDSLRLDKALNLLWTNKIAMIDFPKGKIWQSVKIAARKHFPVSDIRKRMLASVKDETILAINSSTLSTAASRIASYVAALSRDSLVFTIRLTKGSRKVVIESGQNASLFQEDLHILSPATEDVELRWPLEYIMPVLLYIKDDGIAKIKMSKKGQSSLHTKTVTLLIARESKEKPEKE